MKKIILITLLINSFLFSAQAHRGVKTFTQPDGTKFNGVLRGDASFHWIQSQGHIVVYNSKDKYYYIASFDEVKGLVISDNRPEINIDSRAPSRQASLNKHTISEKDKQSIYKIYKKSKTSNYPR